jgi:hypothetical protein
MSLSLEILFFLFLIWWFYKNNIFISFRLMFCLIKIRKAVSTNPTRLKCETQWCCYIVKMDIEQRIFRPWIASYLLSIHFNDEKSESCMFAFAGMSVTVYKGAEDLLRVSVSDRTSLIWNHSTEISSNGYFLCCFSIYSSICIQFTQFELVNI